jgi:hypothetical protein
MEEISISIDSIEADKLSFTYDALQFLITDENEILSILQENIENITLVPFKINFDGNNPFNSFMLVNDFALDKLCFPHLDINTLNVKLITEYSLFISIIKCYLFSLNLLTDYEEFDKNFDFKGVYIYNNKLYIFIDLTKTTIENNLMYRNSPCWFALIDEIVNKKHVCNIKIEEHVTNFFLFNNIFLYFKNLQKEQIEIPTVVYSGIHEKLLYFNYLFGKTKDDSNSILGANYYFTNYNNAIRDGSWSKNYQREFRHGVEITENESGKYIKGGIIRYAIFLGNCLVKENMPNDKIDESELKIERLENSHDYNYEKMTLRISDHDAVWKLNYDSVFLGNMELDDGNPLKDAPIYAVKDFENHLPLTYHLINKKNLKDIYYKNEEYHIL